MKELAEYRMKLMDSLAEAAKAFRTECLALQDPYAPLEQEGWNAHQVAAHTRDVDKLVYGLRARRTALEDNPEFPNFDGNAYMAENYDPAESLSGLLDGFVESVEDLIGLVRALPVEAWSRESRHATLGSGFTLQAWVERNLAHIREHLESVKQAK